jgi:outer membrane receptor protein involved in Fe transport
LGALPAAIAVSLMPTLASAQEAGEKAAVNLDRIEVTGSRIKRADIETSQPVFSLSRDDIAAQGLTSVGDVIQNISANGSTLNSTSTTVVTAKPASACATSAPTVPWCWSTAVGGSVAPASAARST